MARAYLTVAAVFLVLLLLTLGAGLLLHDLLPENHLGSVVLCSIAFMLPVGLPTVQAIVRSRAVSCHHPVAPPCPVSARPLHVSLAIPAGVPPKLTLLCTLRC